MKPTKCPAREKKWGKKSEKRGEERKRKVKVSKFCFLRMPELRKLIFCIWIRRLRSVRPINLFVVSFSSLKHNSDQKTTRLASKHVFRQNLQERMGYMWPKVCLVTRSHYSARPMRFASRGPCWMHWPRLGLGGRRLMTRQAKVTDRVGGLDTQLYNLDHRYRLTITV